MISFRLPYLYCYLLTPDFGDRYISFTFILLLRTYFFFNLETNVLKAELVNMWHAKNEYMISDIMAIVDHTSLNCWHCHGIIIIHGKEWVESQSMFSWFIFPKQVRKCITHYSLLVTHYSEYKHPYDPRTSYIRWN